MGNNPIFPTTKGVLRKLGGDVKHEKAIFNIALTDGANIENFKVTGGELKAGETYTVITESGSFNAVCKDMGDSSFLLGNASLMEPDKSENTGESFLVYIFDEMVGYWSGVAIDANGGSFIKVITPGTIVPIDPKYLPGVCLPVVELSTTFTSGADLTEEEDKLLKAAWERNTPVVIKLPVSFGNTNSDMCAVWPRADHGGICNFTLPYGGKTLVLYSTDNAVSWGCTVQ